MCALVTGVQTCALPIYVRQRFPTDARDVRRFRRPGVRSHPVSRRGDRSPCDPGRSDCPQRPIHTMTRTTTMDENKKRALSAALTQIEKQYGKGSVMRSEEHTSELQSLMRISYAVFCLKKKINRTI